MKCLNFAKRQQSRAILTPEHETAFKIMEPWLQIAAAVVSTSTPEEAIRQADQICDAYHERFSELLKGFTE